MRIIVLASLTGLIVAVVGCSSPNNAINYESAVSVSSSQPGLVYLEAGGLSIRGIGDTAVNFDLVPNVSVQNDSNVALHLLAKWALTSSALLGNIEQIGSFHPIIDSGTMDIGIVHPGSSVALDSIPIVTFSDSDLRSGQLDYSLQFQVQNGPILYMTTHLNGVPDSLSSVSNPLIVYDYNLSVPFSSRYRGIQYTTAASPTPIGIIDAPDSADWLGDSIFMPSPAYPNPATTFATLEYTLPEALDSLTGDLYITPHHILHTIVNGPLQQPGRYNVSLNVSGLSPGLYRVLWTAYKNNTVFTSHGNIMVPLP
jgi:hypothetical protein